MTANTISIQRYYEYSTGTKYLSSAWTDFFGSGICSDIRIMVYEAESFKTTDKFNQIIFHGDVKADFTINNDRKR